MSFNSVDGNIPSITSIGDTGKSIIGTLPTISIAGLAAVGASAICVADFPLLSCIGSSSLIAAGNSIIPSIECTGSTGDHISGTLAAMSVDGLALSGLSGSIDAVFPFLTASGAVFDDRYGSASCRLPKFTCVGEAYDIPSGVLVASFPSIVGTGIGITYSTEVLANLAALGVCLNTEINAPSQYAGFLFDSMCVFNGEIIGCGPSGIYEHKGENDDTLPILAFFRLYSTRLGTSKQKRLKRVYIEGKFVSYLQATSIFDMLDASTYLIECPPVMTSAQLKVPANYTDNGASVGLRITNIGGSDFSVDNITADVVLLALPPKKFGNVGRVKASIPLIVGV